MLDPSTDASTVQRANGLGPEGGLSIAKGIVRNCGNLKELVVADNRLGSGVATLVAAAMRGRTPHCLRGFGYPTGFAPQNKIWGGGVYSQERHRCDGNPAAALDVTASTANGTGE